MVDGWMVDGWMDGWMVDGWMVCTKTMFFGNISKNTHFFGLTVFGPLRRLFKTFFLKNSKKIKKFKFVKKFRTIFFSAIFSIF